MLPLVTFYRTLPCYRDSGALMKLQKSRFQSSLMHSFSIFHSSTIVFIAILLQQSLAALPVTDLFPDCVSSQVTPVCGTGGNVVQSLSANPMISALGIPGWAFAAQNTASNANINIYSRIGPVNSPIVSSFCSAGNGVTFAELGSSGAVDSGTVWFVVYLAQASSALQPIIRISAANGCSYDYSAPTPTQGGPIYFYTNVDDGSRQEISMRIRLAGPVTSATCTNSGADGALVVSSISLTSDQSIVLMPANFVLIYAGFVSGPSASRINCFGSFNFVFQQMIGQQGQLPPKSVMMVPPKSVMVGQPVPVIVNPLIGVITGSLPTNGKGKGPGKSKSKGKGPSFGGKGGKRFLISADDVRYVDHMLDV